MCAFQCKTQTHSAREARQSHTNAQALAKLAYYFSYASSYVSSRRGWWRRTNEWRTTTTTVLSGCLIKSARMCGRLILIGKMWGCLARLRNVHDYNRVWVFVCNHASCACKSEPDPIVKHRPVTEKIDQEIVLIALRNSQFFLALSICQDRQR